MSPIDHFVRMLAWLAGHPLVLEPHLVYTSVPSRTSLGRITGPILLRSGHVMHVAEFFNADVDVEILKYRYHVQDGDSRLVVRWDNAPHHPEVSTFPHHVHQMDSSILQSYVRTLPQAVVAYERLLDDMMTSPRRPVSPT